MLFFLAALAALAAIPAAGAQLDSPGLAHSMEVQKDGDIFEVQATATFDVRSYAFDAENKALAMEIAAKNGGNLAEIAVPSGLIGGNLTFYLDGQRIEPSLRQSPGVSFAVIEFEGGGDRLLEISGAPYSPEFGPIGHVLGIIVLVSVAVSAYLYSTRRK